MVDVSQIGALTAFAAGVISFLSPCVLPLVPGYLSYVAGHSLTQDSADSRIRLAALRLSLFFVFGFTTVFVALGASATILGQLLLRYRAEANLVGGVIVIVFGLFMTGLLKIPWFYRDLRIHAHLRGGAPLSAYLLGLAFAFGWTPCIGPVLGAILTMSAVSPAASSGTALLAIYSLGLGLPFLLAAVFTRSLLHRLRGMSRLGRWLQVGAGAGMIIMGIAMLTGQLTRFSYWLLEMFPALGTIG